MAGELPPSDCQLIPEKEDVDSVDAPPHSGSANEDVRMTTLKPSRQTPLEPENEDFLFLRSLLPYITALPLVQRLSLRSEINTAVTRAWEKRRYHPHEEALLDSNAKPDKTDGRVNFKLK